jgi:glycosyltransferase involved in cell wall biosynthesis
MRVLFAASEVGFGGGERLFIDLVRSAIKLDLDVTVSVKENSELRKMLDSEGVRTLSTLADIPHKYDVLIANDARSLRQHRSNSKNQHFICHGPWEATLLKLIFCLIYRVQVWTVSNYVSASFGSFFQSLLKPEILMYGPANQFRSGFELTKREARRILGIPQNAFVVANVARFHPVKRLPLFLQVVEDAGSETFAAIAVSRNFKSKEENEAHSIFTSNKSRWANLRVVEEGDVRLVLSASDVYLSTSVSETLGISMMEGLLFGLPVLSTAGDGPRDFIRPGLNGYIVNSDKPKEISKLLNELSNNLELLRSMALVAENTISNRSPDKALDQILGTNS